MKRLMRFCTLLMAALLVYSLGIPAYAAGSVTYDGKANEFIFKPGTEDSPTSLFENFQNVMPGDTLTEQILIKNIKSNKMKIRVYLRSQGAQEDTDDFLSEMKLTVQQKGKKSPLFEAPADETADLTKWTSLGTISPGGKITLDVTLEVPVTMGNAYQNRIGYIDWEFKIEELPASSADPESPKTGDAGHIFLYSGLMLVSLGALCILLAGRYKKQKEHL